ASYGTDNAAPVTVDIDTDPEMRAIAGFAGMRGGKGLVMVKSGGNSFTSFSSESDTGLDQCTQAIRYKLSCQNASFDYTNDMPQVVTVGAVNALGVKASYSTAGSSLLLAGLGGEYGAAHPDKPGKAGPAIVTTDLAGCDRGYARTNTDYYNDFEQPGTQIQKTLNPNCDYTSIMNGTSAAAPTVTGVVALMLGANPNLSWRDLRLILAKTARKIDAARAPLVLPLTDGDYIAEPGWTKNAAGLWFHNWYGFGLVDAAAAVAMAKATTSYLPGAGLIDSGWNDAAATDTLNLVMPVGTKARVESNITFSPTRTVEAVQIRVTIAGTAPLGDLGIELISPSGTRSVLMTAHNAFQSATSVSHLLLLSNAFNEESTQGKWTLRVVDVNGRQDAVKQAILNNWSLRIYGR
ncbi:MAG: proprotein convertase P-domain-containing protein, partial [Herbaspirillum sp.]